MKSSRPSVSRDTRLLLGIVLVSIAMLWILARIRFPDRVPTSNPVPPVLAQITPSSPLDDIAASVAQLEPRLQPLIVGVEVQIQGGQGAGATQSMVSALRFRDDLAVALIGGRAGAEPRVVGATEVARDPASQLSVIRVAGGSGSAPSLSTWTPRRLAYPRFMISAAASTRGASFRPIFIGSLQTTASPTWSGAIWMLTPPVDLPPGTFLFTVDGALAGLAIERDGQRAVVPADTVLGAADRLAREAPSRRGQIGIDVQPLTPALAAATGAAAGVIVAWVDPHGPAAELVSVADVVERIGDEPVATLEQWRARVARLNSDETVVLGIRRRNQTMEVRVTASSVVPASSSAVVGDRSPGLVLRTLPRVGAAVARVEPGSPAARAGLEVGDVLTLVGDVQAPSAAQITRALAAAPRGRPIVIGFTRAGSHRVLALERTW